MHVDVGSLPTIRTNSSQHAHDQSVDIHFNLYISVYSNYGCDLCYSDLGARILWTR